MGVEPINVRFADESPADEGQDLYNVVEIRGDAPRPEACKATVLLLYYIPITRIEHYVLFIREDVHFIL